MPRTQKTTRIIKRVGFCLRWRLRPTSIIQRSLRETRLQLLEHPRFLSGVDVWPLGWCGLVTVISATVHVVAKHYENN